MSDTTTRVVCSRCGRFMAHGEAHSTTAGCPGPWSDLGALNKDLASSIGSWQVAYESAQREIESLRRDKQLLTIDLEKLIVQNAKLFDEVNDWRESAAKAVSEICGGEEHCTCVGPLRHQLVRRARRIVECEEEVIHRGRLNQLAISLADEFERAVASRNPVGGMSVSPSGDFIACAQLPSAVKRMAWWAREIRKEQAQLEGGE